MNMFVTADLHFNHKSILKFTGRPFKDLDEMKSSIIDEINTKVEPTDILYNLGDLYFGKSQEELRELLSEIKCRMHFIRGNHDHDNFVKVMKEFGHVDDYLELKVNGQLIVMSHYPFAFWRNAHYGSIMFHGHMHSRYQHPGRAIDVGYDSYFKILEFSEAMDLAKAKPIHEIIK